MCIQSQQRAWHLFAAMLLLKDYFTTVETWFGSESFFNEYEMRSAVTSDYNQLHHN